MPASSWVANLRNHIDVLLFPPITMDIGMKAIMTPGRRNLNFENFDEIMVDVERLLNGCDVVGGWSFAQICRHLSSSLRVTADLPASTPQDPSKWMAEELKRQIFESGLVPEGYVAPQLVVPAETVAESDEVESLRQAIAYYRASSGPVIPHIFLGPLTKVEWDRYHLMHCAHHLSFVIPKA